MSSMITEDTSAKETTGGHRGLGIFLAFVFALGAFFSGLQLGQTTVSGDEQKAGLFNFLSSERSVVAANEDPDLDNFWRVWELLEEKYSTVNSSSSISVEDRIEGAIDGLVGAYDDPYTVYLPPQDSATFEENISGNFSGVGMEVGMREGVITVISPLPNTPAEQAGIMAGDAIVQIDGTSSENMSIDEAVQLIRGEKGTVVTLEIYREGELEFLEIPVTRDTINIPTVETEIIDDIFVIKVYSFNAVAEAQVVESLNEYLQSGTDKLVLDLRGNPGGYLQSAVAIASFFLPAGKVVVTEEFNEHEGDQVFRSRGRQTIPFTPENLVVLVDNGSASASEILAGALKDHQVGTILGSQTFGKGSVQELVELKNGASLKVTVARWLTPNGTSISEGGLTPDIKISRTPAQRLADEDPQIDAAVRFLRGEEVVSESFEDRVTTTDDEATILDEIPAGE